jgi:ADP-heptose:LPS heptosyltransferase
MKKSKNALITIFVFLFKLFFRKKNDFNIKNPKILIVSTTALGDTLWATPAIREVKKKYPSSYLAVLTTSFGKQVLKNNPFIDKIFIFNNPLFINFFSLLINLRKKMFQIIFVFHSSQRIVFPLCALLGAKKLIGIKNINKDLDHLFTKTFSFKDIHQIERRMDICKEIGVNSKDFSLNYFPSIKEKKSIINFIQHEKISLPFIIFHPGAKDFYKCWPKQCFIKLGELIQKNIGYQIIVTGDKREIALTEEITKKIKTAKSYCGKFSFPSFAALLQQSEIIITNDTGPLHLALAMQKKTICVFSPTDPNICGPFNENKEVHTYYSSKTCTPCLKRKCQEPFCLLQISPYDVFEQIKKSLKKQ